MYEMEGNCLTSLSLVQLKDLRACAGFGMFFLLANAPAAPGRAGGGGTAPGGGGGAGTFEGGGGTEIKTSRKNGSRFFAF